MTRILRHMSRLSPLAGQALRLSLCLAIVLVGAWSVQACAARAAVTQMVICSDHGPDVVWLDAAGHPVSAPQDCSNCPECLAASAGAALPARAETSRPDQRLSEILMIDRPIEAPALPGPAPVARGPPCAAQDRMTA